MNMKESFKYTQSKEFIEAVKTAAKLLPYIELVIINDAIEETESLYCITYNNEEYFTTPFYEACTDGIPVEHDGEVTILPLSLTGNTDFDAMNYIITVCSHLALR